MKRFQFKLLALGLSVVSAALLAGLGLLAARSNAAGNEQAVTAIRPALTVTLTQARTSVLPLKLSANGNVVAWQEAIIGAEVNGLRVQEINAGIGDQVQKGQLLATFAAESVQTDVALARAALMEATAAAADATANAARARAVQSSGALSAQQVDQLLTAELMAKARVASAQAQLEAQQLRLGHTRLLAPDSGIVSARSASVGAVVGAGAEMFRLIRQGRLEWRAEVTATELGRIKAGTGVLVTAPDGTQARGRVRMVSPTVDAQTRNGLIYVDILGGQLLAGQFPAGPPQGKLAPSGLSPAAPNVPAHIGTGRRDSASGSGMSSAVREATSVGAFKPGMFARGEFDLGSSSALSVLQTALVVRDGFNYVFRVGADKRVAQVKVQTGRLLGDQVEILSGIKPEDKLVATGGGFLSDGDLVRVADESRPNSAAAPVSQASSAIK
jgi:RND family efflux transporter MFP subunit